MPEIEIGPQILSDFDKAIQKEWIVTNGLGGYASSTTLGVNTRKFHGLLVAAFRPPTDRMVLLTKLDEELRIGEKAYPLGTNEFKHGTQPEGHRFLFGFSLAPFPTYRYSIDGVRLQKMIFMPQGKNATIVIYEMFNRHEKATSMRISPLVNSRHFYSVTDKDELNWDFNQKTSQQTATIQPSNKLSTLTLYSSDGQYFAEEGDWVEEIYFRVDDSRGEACLDDSFRPGCFEITISSQERKRFFMLAVGGRDEKTTRAVLSSIAGRLGDIDSLLNREFDRRRDLLERFQERYKDAEVKDWLRWLVLATDSFIVNRESTRKKSVIAGYHWFEDWGRDSLISLPGLTLVTGRFEDAREILLTFKHYCREGVIPNRFPDRAGDRPDYNTVDATLWYINAVFQYLKYTGDFDFVRGELWNTLKSIIRHHVQGTLYDIRMEDDGLIAHGPQLTWMDATTDGRFVTPREGKAVEIQALWYNALKTMELLAIRFSVEKDVKKYYTLAERAREGFVEQFWNPQEGCLFDVIHGETRNSSLRPNQIVAVALDFSMLGKSESMSVVDSVWRRLWGTYGVRTLSEDDSRYVGKYFGDWSSRNSAYHNGTAWPWLLGPFITAFLKVKNYEEQWRSFAFKTFLQPLVQHELYQAGLGTISEIFDGDPPHLARGCVAQAWSVAEPLRAFVEDILSKRPPYESQIRVGVGS